MNRYQLVTWSTKRHPRPGQGSSASATHGAWPVSAIAESDDVSALLERVEALYNQGKYEEAMPLAERTLGLDHPSVATGFNNLAELYRIQGRYIDAELLYERAVEF